MKSPGLFALTLLLLFPSTEALAGTGRVSYVASGDAYLDVGSDDGLTQGGKVDLFRRRRKVGTCELVEVAPHHAVCRSERAAPGDRFALPAAPEKPRPKQRGRPTVPGQSELAERHKLLVAAPLEKVAYKRARRVGAPVWSARAAAGIRQQVWANTSNDVFARPSLDGSARAGIGLFRGLYASGAFRLVGDVVAPNEQRFRPGEQLELYVWDAAVGIADGPVVGAVGRFRPRKAPGMQLLDGVQAGLNAFGGALEVGAYAGAIPDLVTIAPSVDRLTAGAYFGLDLGAGDNLLVLPRARVGLVSTPDVATVRAEAEAQTQVLWRDLVSIGGSARVGTGGTADPLPTLDAARVDADLVPWSALRLHAAWRYLAPLAVDFDAVSKVPPVGGAHHGDLGASWQASPWLVVGGASGLGIDELSGEVRGWAGPEVGLPQAFGSLGGLQIGWLEELGFWSGRSAYVSTTLAPFSVLRVTTRASYFENEAVGDSVREAALMTFIDAPLLPWLSLRGRAHAQGALPSLDGVARATPGLLIVDVGVSGAM